MTTDPNCDVRGRQDPLIKRYQGEPEAALITDRAKTSGGADNNPFRGTVHPGEQEQDVSLRFGIHRAVGGYHDLPNPGDLLCAALAACLDSTIRIIANRLNVELSALEVEVRAEADVRGTLLVDPEVPVGFQQLKCEVDVQAVEGTDPKLLQQILAAAEYSCVNLQTLRSGVAVETRFKRL